MPQEAVSSAAAAALKPSTAPLHSRMQSHQPPPQQPATSAPLTQHSHLASTCQHCLQQLSWGHDASPQLLCTLAAHLHAESAQQGGCAQPSARGQDEACSSAAAQLQAAAVRVIASLLRGSTACRRLALASLGFQGQDLPGTSHEAAFLRQVVRSICAQ